MKDVCNIAVEWFLSTNKRQTRSTRFCFFTSTEKSCSSQSIGDYSALQLKYRILYSNTQLCLKGVGEKAMKNGQYESNLKSKYSFKSNFRSIELYITSLNNIMCTYSFKSNYFPLLHSKTKLHFSHSLNCNLLPSVSLAWRTSSSQRFTGMKNTPNNSSYHCK